MRSHLAGLVGHLHLVQAVGVENVEEWMDVHSSGWKETNQLGKEQSNRVGWRGVCAGETHLLCARGSHLSLGGWQIL
jgi:hypothetical protein